MIERFLPRFYAAFDVRLVPSDFLTAGEHVVVLGRFMGRTREGDVPIDVPFAHVWTVTDGRLARLRFFTDTATLASALAAGRH